MRRALWASLLLTAACSSSGDDAASTTDAGGGADGSVTLGDAGGRADGGGRPNEAGALDAWSPPPGDAGACTAPDGGVGARCNDGGDCACGAVCSLGGCVPPTGCDQARLAWDGPTTNADGTCLTDLGGFVLAYGHTSGGPYPNVVDVGMPCVPGPTLPCGDGGSASQLSCAYLITGLEAGTWYFIATDYDTAANVSAPSNEASKTVSCP